MTRWSFTLLVVALGALVASVPAAAPITGNYTVNGFFVQSWTKNGELILSNGYDYEQSLTIDPGGFARLSPGISSDYLGSWSKHAGAYSADFSESYTPQIQTLFVPSNVKKVRYRLLHMHPLANGFGGSLLISLKIKGAGTKVDVKNTGAIFGTRI